MNLTYLFHWSPADRYEDIARHGLLPFQDPTVASARLHYICAGVDPQRAWVLSGATEWCAEVDLWDLWMIHVAPKTELHVRWQFGPQIEEVKIHTIVPPSQLWWAGRRNNSGVPADQLTSLAET